VQNGIVLAWLEGDTQKNLKLASMDQTWRWRMRAPLAMPKINFFAALLM
jgi:hypothetical protein